MIKSEYMMHMTDLKQCEYKIKVAKVGEVVNSNRVGCLPGTTDSKEHESN